MVTSIWPPPFWLQFPNNRCSIKSYFLRSVSFTHCSELVLFFFFQYATFQTLRAHFGNFCLGIWVEKNKYFLRSASKNANFRLPIFRLITAISTNASWKSYCALCIELKWPGIRINCKPVWITHQDLSYLAYIRLSITSGFIQCYLLVAMETLRGCYKKRARVIRGRGVLWGVGVVQTCLSIDSNVSGRILLSKVCPYFLFILNERLYLLHAASSYF